MQDGELVGEQELRIQGSFLEELVLLAKVVEAVEVVEAIICAAHVFPGLVLLEMKRAEAQVALVLDDEVVAQEFQNDPFDEVERL